MTAKPGPSGIVATAIEVGASALRQGAVAGARALLTGVARIPFSRREFLLLAKDLGCGIAIDKVISYAADYSDWVKENQGMLTLLAYFGISGRGGAKPNLRLSATSTTKAKRSFFGAPLAKVSKRALELIKTARVVTSNATKAHISAGKQYFKVSVDRATSTIKINCSMPEIAAALLLVGIGNKDLLFSENEGVAEEALLSLCEQGIAHLLANSETFSEREALHYLRSIATNRLLSYPTAIVKKVAEKYSLTIDHAAKLREQVLSEVEEWHPGHYFSDFGKDEVTGDVKYVIGSSTFSPIEEERLDIPEKPEFMLEPVTYNLTPVVSGSAAAMMDAIDLLLTYHNTAGVVDFYQPRHLLGKPSMELPGKEGTFTYVLSRPAMIGTNYSKAVLEASWVQFMAYREVSSEGNPVGGWKFTLIGKTTLLENKLSLDDITALDEDTAITIETLTSQKSLGGSENQPVELAVNFEQLAEGLFGGRNE